MSESPTAEGEIKTTRVPELATIFRWFRRWVLPISAIVLSGASYCASRSSADAAIEANRQARESALLVERINACTRLLNIADDLMSAAYGFSASQSAEALVQSRTVAGNYSNFREAATLRLLGPDTLAHAERDLDAVLSRVDWSVGQSDRPALNRVLVEAENSVRSFESRCIEALGAYRTGPMPLRQPTDSER